LHFQQELSDMIENSSALNADEEVEVLLIHAMFHWCAVQNL
jgi:hypothetical protein